MRNFRKLDAILGIFSILSAFSLSVVAVEYLSFAMQGSLDESFTNKDFSNYWIAGRLVLWGESADLFGPHENYFRHMIDAFGPSFFWHNWSYPPHYLLLTWWTGYFSYGVALCLFLLVTLVPFVVATRAFVGRLDLYVLAMITPFMVTNVWLAQNGFLTAALVLGALALRENRPVIAGILLGLLTVKPQLGVLFPLLLLAERRWVMILSASLTTIVLIGLTAVVFGIEAWRGYFIQVVPYQAEVMRDLKGVFLILMISLYGGLRSLGLAYSEAAIIHAVCALPVTLLTIYSFFTTKDPTDRAVMLIVATLLVSPYALSYDMGMVSAAAAVIAIRAGCGEPSGTRLTYLCSLVAILPLLALGLAILRLPFVLIPPVLLTLFIAVLSCPVVFGRQRTGRPANGTNASIAGRT